MASKQSNRHISSARRPHSLDEPRGPMNHPSDPGSAAGTKRLFSTRELRTPANTEAYGELENIESDKVHSEKRHRNSDWPLPVTNAAQGPHSRAPLRSRNAPNSHPPRSLSRPSKFIEGSMNDRTSLKPPTPYLGAEDEFLERFEPDTRGRKMAQPRKLTHNREPSLGMASDGGKSEISRHSTIFRFGKSIALSFNPVNWKIWSKHHQHEDEEAAQQRILRERQEKAEQVYWELKESGRFSGGVGTNSKFVRAEDLKQLINRHDSGIVLDYETASGARRSLDMTRAEKREGHVFLQRPEIPNAQQDQSFALHNSSRQSTPKRPSFNLSRASLSNIKKASNYESETSSSQSQQAKRIPSRKDLQKQQKLVKRVSDLEGKLEAARRQLLDYAAEPIPSQPLPKVGRHKFVPGALSSLPSERLLAAYASAEGEDEKDPHDNIGRALTVDNLNESLPLSSGASLSGGQSATHADEQIRKPLPAAADDLDNQLMRSLEADLIVQDESIKQDDTRQLTTESSDVASAITSSYENIGVRESQYESGDESTPRAKSVKPQPNKNGVSKKESHVLQRESTALAKKSEAPQNKSQAPRRKRKSFEGLADDGGCYKPTADSDSESEFDLSTTRKKLGTSRPPRKLQKVTQEPVKPAILPKHKAPPNRTSSQKTAAAKLVKNKTSNLPSSSFAASDKTGDSDEIAYVADPARGHGVPPMPPMPKSVRLASGEVVNTSAAPSVPAAKLTRTSPDGRQKSELTRSDPSFIWDEDVF